MRAETEKAMRSRAGRVREVSALQLTLYQVGMLTLAVALFVLAGGRASGANLGPASPFLVWILALWGAFILLGCVLRRRVTLKLRIAGDCLMSIALVWWTGGVESFFLPILFANVLASSTYYDFRRALLLGTVSSAALATITIARIFGWSPAAGIEIGAGGVKGREAYLLSCLIGQAIALHVIAFLGSWLMGGLRRALRINDLIVENIGEGLLAVDERGRLLLMNHEALRMLGYPKETPWRGLLPEEVFRRDTDRQLREILAQRRSETCLEWHAGRDRVFPLNIRIREIHRDSGAGRLWVALLRDETLERRAVEAEARVRHLEEIEDMARGLAHEIRNPLGCIRGCVQELGKGLVTPEQAERLSGIVLRESDRLDRIVAEFMEFSRTRATLREPVDLYACIREVSESLRQRSDAAQLTIEVVEPGTRPIFVSGQRELVYTLFLNLGVNAIEASNPGGSVRLEIRKGFPDGWEVCVSDRGCGMTEAVMRRIFNPFFTTKTREGGLGLSIVEKIVHQHKGTIDVQSERGIGSTFKVWLPSVKSPVDSPATAPALAGV